MDNELLKSIDSKLTAIIALMACYMDTPENKRPAPEMIIANSGSGLNPTNIAKILGKKPDTVIKAINRGKNKK